MKSESGTGTGTKREVETECGSENKTATLFTGGFQKTASRTRLVCDPRKTRCEQEFRWPTFSSIRHSTPTLETGSALMTPLGLRMSMGS
ncbi:hypothetical protein EVAR_79168_1 [Eumeta japonica]|uniref:Uncharacterized protein n=1 Tax=Eumeta variegata TaxID=151549 RepID=A0A4C1UTI7_EUMVA|nr:hypothetical protein EVAR_79168_1 [Eumeta japonica]